ncbi:MAG: Gfo/Idh/MocA family protein [Chloroflexota bacterium]
MKKIRIGLVGAGFAASFHAQCYRRVAGVEVELRAVTAAHRERAQKLADEFGIERVDGSVDALLADPEVDLVDVCAPNNLHAPLIEAAAAAGKHVAVEKPLTGYFGDDWPDPNARIGDVVPGARMRAGALANADRALAACERANVRLLYAENWVYAPGVQKVRRLLEQAGGTILRIEGEESHSGSHAAYYRRWRTAGGGTLLGKGCHPLGATLYLKRVEGQRRNGVPIRPRGVVAETARLTRTPGFEREAVHYIKHGYDDIEDWASILVTFDDGTVAQITASDTTLGGIRNYLTVFASNAVATVNVNPNNLCVAYAPDASIFGDEYITEKIETKAGWSFPAPDENWVTGYPHEIQDFVEAVVNDREPLSGAALARDVIAVVFAGYESAAEGKRVVID